MSAIGIHYTLNEEKKILRQSSLSFDSVAFPICKQDNCQKMNFQDPFLFDPSNTRQIGLSPNPPEAILTDTYKGLENKSCYLLVIPKSWKLPNLQINLYLNNSSFVIFLNDFLYIVIQIFFHINKNPQQMHNFIITHTYKCITSRWKRFTGLHVHIPLIACTYIFIHNHI